MLREGLIECSKRNERKADVPLLTCLAAFHIALGLDIYPKSNNNSNDILDKEKIFEEATMLLNEAERHSQNDLGLLLRKGLLLLAQRKLPQAEYTLRMVISQQEKGPSELQDNVAAHVALGCASFLAGNYTASLNCFQTVLSRLPGSPVELRMAIGHALLKLGKIEQAQRAFERVLALDSHNVPALVAIALIHINAGPRHLPRGMQLIKQAYDLDKQHPVVLFHLANHFFFKKDYFKALSLANNSLNNALCEIDRSNATYVIGKIEHAQGHFDEAFSYYSEAIRLNPNLTLAQLGLGQVCLHRGDISFATSCFERVLELQKISGGELKDQDLWTMMGLAAGSESLLKKAMAQGAKSFEVLIALAVLLETKDPNEAVKIYRMARELDGERFARDIELVGNFAVMLHLVGEYTEALELIDNAIRLLPNHAEETMSLFKFNKARLLEDMNRLDEAEALYKKLSLLNPNDISTHLRLGIISSKRGQHNEATEHLKEAIGLDEGNLDAWCLLASSHLRIKALTPARKAYERILKQGDRHDPFALCALGNIYIEFARHEGRSAARSENLKRALEFFVKALSLQRNNYVAANGFGSILAELGRWKEAKDVFLQVKQAMPGFMDASLNLAHCFVELGQFAAAINAYEHILTHHQGHQLSTSRKATLYLFIARAHYVQAKMEKTVGAFQSAISQLERAAALLSNDAPIRFNIALCQQEVASVMLKRGVDACTDEELQHAMSLIDAAQNSFSVLKDLTDSGVDKLLVEQRGKYCQSLRQMLRTRLEALQARATMRQTKLEAVKRERATHLMEEQAKREREEKAHKMEQERMEEIRKELAAKLRYTEERIRAADGISDSDEEESIGVGTTVGKGRTKRPRSAKTKALRHNESRESDGDGSNVDDDHDSDEISHGRSRRRKFALSKDLISDDDNVISASDGEGGDAKRESSIEGSSNKVIANEHDHEGLDDDSKKDIDDYEKD